MKVLLDTCTFLWMCAADERLSARARRHLLDPGNELILSAASSWEIAIKVGLGKLRLPEPAETYVPSRMERHALAGLAVEHAHALATRALPAHHGDPFDRLLVAQARHEGLVVLTPDPAFRPYEVETAW